MSTVDTRSAGAKSESLAERVQALRLPPTPAATGINATTTMAWVIATLACSGLVFVALNAYVYGPGRVAGTVPTTATAASSDSSSNASVNSSTPKPDTSETAAGTESSATPAGAMVLEAKGYIVPEQQILVSPQVSGRIITLNIKEGRQVEKGFVLATLEATEYRADVDRAQATVDAAQAHLAELNQGNRPDEIRQVQAELAEAEATLAQLRRSLDRSKELFSQKILNKQDFEDAESQYIAQSRRVDRLRAAARLSEEGEREERKIQAAAELRQAQAQLVLAKWRLDNCTIKAPISGTILKKNAEEGNIVNPVAFNGSYSLCDMADLSKLEVDLSIQERDIARVFRRQRCQVRAEAFPKRVYEGVVSRLMPIADRSKGTVSVRVALTVPAEEQGQFLKPEMGVLVTFFNDEVPEAPAATNAPFPIKAAE